MRRLLLNGTTALALLLPGAMAKQYVAILVADEDERPATGSVVQVVGCDGAETVALPRRPFDLTVAGHYDSSQDGEPGYFCELSAVTWRNDEEEEYARKIGVWHAPVSAAAAQALADGSFPRPLFDGINDDGVTGSTRFYIADRRLEAEGSIVTGLMERYSARQAVLTDRSFLVQVSYDFKSVDLESLIDKIDLVPWSDERTDWTPLDYAVAFSLHARSENPDLFGELFFLLDSQTFHSLGESVLAVFLLRQEPVCRDPIRTLRYSPEGAGEVAIAYPEGGFNMVANDFAGDPDFVHPSS